MSNSKLNREQRLAYFEVTQLLNPQQPAELKFEHNYYLIHEPYDYVGYEYQILTPPVIKPAPEMMPDDWLLTGPSLIRAATPSELLPLTVYSEIDCLYYGPDNVELMLLILERMPESTLRQLRQLDWQLEMVRGMFQRFIKYMSLL